MKIIIPIFICMILVFFLVYYFGLANKPKIYRKFIGGEWFLNNYHYQTDDGKECVVKIWQKFGFGGKIKMDIDDMPDLLYVETTEKENYIKNPN